MSSALSLVLLAATCAAEYPLSLQLEVLERDLTSRDYHDVLQTMIPTDLAAEWQRVATTDNYHLFAQEHGGLEKVQADPQLWAAYERRRKIATDFLDLLRTAYEQKKLPPPFADDAVLLKALQSAAGKAKLTESGELPIRYILPSPGAEQNWPCFRGPTGQGIVFDTHIPLVWSDTEQVVWKVVLPGRGNSSPVIWNDRLFVTAESEPRPDDAPLLAKDSAPDRLLLCYSTDGQRLWQHAAPRPPDHEVLYWKNTLASSTPVTDGERVIAFLGNAGLLCCDLEGKRLWHVDLGSFPTTHGPGSAPVLYQDLVILIQDQNKGTSLCAAFDKRTGKEVWRQSRKNSMGWSNPVLLRIGQTDQLIFNGSHEVVAYAPATGEELWRHPGTTIESIPMIVSGGGLLYSTSGRNGPTFAFLPNGRGDISEEALVWRSERGGPHVPSPAYLDGRLYMVNDTGILSCLEAATGKTIYQKRLRGRFSASPLIVEDKLLFLSEEGVTYIVQSGPQFQLLQENRLEGTTYATPAVVGGRIYFRTTTSLICVGK